MVINIGTYVICSISSGVIVLVGCMLLVIYRYGVIVSLGY